MKYFEEDNDFADDRSVALSNGVRLPLLGLGTTHSGGYCHDAVVFALRDCGYPMIDTAKRYGVEAKLGEAIQDSGVRREDLFIISKLWPVDFGFSSARNAFQESCRKLGTDYLDSYLFHFPDVPNWFTESPRKIREETWRTLEQLYESGKIRSIGVSNYLQSDLEELLDDCSIPPQINQMEFHPFQNPHSLRNFCSDNDITFMGFCPLAKATILSEAPIIAIAQRHNRTPAQICIRWSVQQNVPAIPKSVHFRRLEENASVFDFCLSDEEMAILNGLNDNRRLIRLDNLQAKFQLPDGYKLEPVCKPATVDTMTAAAACGEESEGQRRKLSTSGRFTICPTLRRFSSESSFSSFMSSDEQSEFSDSLPSCQSAHTFTQDALDRLSSAFKLRRACM